MEAAQSVRAAEAAVAAVEPAGARIAARDVALRRLLAVGDTVAVVAALVLALAVPAIPRTGHDILWAIPVLPLMISLFKLYGLYDRDIKRVNCSTVDDLPALFHAVVIGALVVWLYARGTPLGRFDFAEILLLGVSMIALVAAVRFAIRSFAARLIGQERALVVGGGQMAEALVSKIAAHPEYGITVVGALAVDEQAAPGRLPIMGAVDDLDQVAAGYGVTRVVFSAREIDEPKLERMLGRCRQLSLKASVLPGLGEVLGSAVEIDDVEGVTLLGVNPPWLPRSSRAVKRAMDLAIAIPLLVALLPLLLLLALAIELDSRGPVLFAQERVGRSGRRFRLLKLRTMVTDAEQRRAELLERSTDPDWLKLERDPRITRVGRWLRRLSLDELPQLWNVVCGEMSLVGPRPLIPVEDERVQGWRRRRLDLTPGITGYWQVLGRTRIPFDEMVKLDYLYVMNWSVWEDVRLLLRTLPVVIGGRGAN
ncbi:MAG TPA: exopolysaccharide biosynthesis polyprenyl glycosylphosphotransferase [Solirubrobacteraceae bacterium]|jgi:exopolysaccharide biosynthesis polyprenyl glycosylphosphotransferase